MRSFFCSSNINAFVFTTVIIFLQFKKYLKYYGISLWPEISTESYSQQGSTALSHFSLGLSWLLSPYTHHTAFLALPSNSLCYQSQKPCWSSGQNLLRPEMKMNIKDTEILLNKQVKITNFTNNASPNNEICTNISNFKPVWMKICQS